MGHCTAIISIEGDTIETGKLLLNDKFVPRKSNERMIVFEITRQAEGRNKFLEL